MALLGALVLAGTVYGLRHDGLAPLPRTVFMGDSITQGDSAAFDVQPGATSWVRYAVADRRSPWAFDANVAVAGQTLGMMQARFAHDVLARHPKAVVIMGGTNDVLQGLPLEGAMASLRAMVEAAQAEGAEVWVVAPPPLAHLIARPIEPLVLAEAALAADTGASFVDPRAALSDDDGDWLPGLSSDGVHPTPEGASRLADAILDGLGAEG